jgi:hypothetical protein
MNKMNTLRLLQAAAWIAQASKKEVTAIQFEDGSGYKFNFQLEGSSDWKFLDLTGRL